ncbi:hypothetical protein PRIEUP_LOCUS434 [Pristimantis euphronides]
MNDLVRDLNLPKDAAELLGSRLKSRNLLLPGVPFSWFRHREKELVPYFAQEDKLVYCIDVKSLMGQFKIKYYLAQWYIFIDQKKVSKQFYSTTVVFTLLRFHPCRLFRTLEGNL